MNYAQAKTQARNCQVEFGAALLICRGCSIYQICKTHKRYGVFKDGQKQ
ncbi:unnamed protein product [marine sediment metagenome]|uniref:Uncharacterized protein n=1 Tax=marine sediment metagenome TaxID=412755 RepID=X0Z3I0_9ZZZZ